MNSNRVDSSSNSESITSDCITVNIYMLYFNNTVCTSTTTGVLLRIECSELTIFFAAAISYDGTVDEVH